MNHDIFELILPNFHLQSTHEAIHLMMMLRFKMEVMRFTHKKVNLASKVLLMIDHVRDSS